MKKIYDLSKEEVLEKEKEFKETFYGKLIYQLKNTMYVVEIAYFIIMMIVEWDLEAKYYALSDSILGLLIFAGFTVLIKFKYYGAVKEYIENTKETKKEENK